MKIILTSALGGSRKVDGRRVSVVLLNDNGLLGKLKALWKGTNIYTGGKNFFVDYGLTMVKVIYTLKSWSITE